MSARSIDDARAKHDLLAQYIAECERIDDYKTGAMSGQDVEAKRFAITPDELMEVFERRRDRIYNALQNAGIKLHAEAVDTLPSIANAMKNIVLTGETTQN